MNKKCPGCGYKLQSENSLTPGYIPANTENKAIYCERCFKIIHYNDALIVSNPDITKRIIDIVNRKGKYAFFLIDFLNINTETIETFKQITVPKTLVISKCDIIPRSVRYEKIVKWLKNEYKIKDEIVVMSSIKNYNTNFILDTMSENKVVKAYVLGYTNAGKSSLINKIYEKNMRKISTITTSIIPNTTLDFINLKVYENITLIDSPGFALKQDIYEPNDIELIKKINSKKAIKPVTYQVNFQESIKIENKLRMENMSNIKNSLTIYLSNDLKLDKIFLTNNALYDLPNITIAVPDNSDIVIKSLGFINVKKKCEIKIYSQYYDLIEVRKSIF